MTSPLITHDRQLGAVVCGTDEAGRGCFAGPLVAAAVRFDYSTLSRKALRELAALNDSKKLTAARREELYPLVLKHAAALGISQRSARSIDERGLHVCNLEAMRCALAGVRTKTAVLLSDGYDPGLVEGCEVRKVIRGDGTSAVIAAASIVAKVQRDRLMTRLAQIYPGYGFERHAGYGTPDHQAALARLGLTPAHRRSFKGIVELAQGA